MNNKYNKLVHWACNYNFLYGNNKFILLYGDICRTELLVEIEGISDVKDAI